MTHLVINAEIQGLLAVLANKVSSSLLFKEKRKIQNFLQLTAEN
jgi:hypothetical protein